MRDDLVVRLLRLFFAVALSFAAATGCSGPNAQISRCNAEKQELLSVIEQEKLKSQAATERALALEARLDESEKQLAQLVRPGSRIGDDSQPRMATSPPRPLSSSPRSTAEPVREPAKTQPPKDRSGIREMKLQGPSRGEENRGTLAALAERDPRLEYDAASGTARFRLDVSFDADSAALTAEGRRKLDELSSWLKSPETSELRVMVSGYSTGMRKAAAGTEGERYATDRELGTARALAVADYLDSHGVKDDRLAVIGSGSKRSSTGANAVEIVLSEPGTSMAGAWSAPSKRR